MQGYEGYDWLFAANIRFDDLRSYGHIYKARWGIETVFRVQEEVMIKSKSRDRVRYFLFLFEALLYDLWEFYRNGVAMGYPYSFSAFVLTVHLVLLIELLMDAVLEVLDVEVRDPERVVQGTMKRLGIPWVIAAS